VISYTLFICEAIFLLSNRVSRTIQQQSSREYVFQGLNQIKACPQVVFYEIFLRRNVIMFLHSRIAKPCSQK